MVTDTLVILPAFAKVGTCPHLYQVVVIFFKNLFNFNLLALIGECPAQVRWNDWSSKKYVYLAFKYTEL